LTFTKREAQEYAKNIKALTKIEMVEFYKRYIDPSSDQCARLMVYMSSQIKAGMKPDGDPSSVHEDASGTDIEYITSHLQHKLRVSHEEIEDAVELWREIHAPDLKTRETKLDNVDGGRIIHIDDINAFKASLIAVDRTSVDLGKFEQGN
jgi:hypothetical protein